MVQNANDNNANANPRHAAPVLNQSSVLTELLKLSPRVARVIYIGLAVIILGGFAAQLKVEPTDMPKIAIYVAATAIILFIVSRFHGLISFVLAWFAVIVSMVWILGFMAQTMFDSRLLPIRAGCFFPPWQIGCPAEAPKADRLQGTVEQPPTVTPDAGGSEIVDEDGEIIVNEVYVQFAGSLQRDTVKEAAKTLVENGWGIQGAARGGERTSAAYGLNEIRYFHPEDKPLAERLAAKFAASAPWVQSLSTSDFSAAGYTVSSGYLEVWTSVQ